MPAPWEEYQDTPTAERPPWEEFDSKPAPAPAPAAPKRTGAAAVPTAAEAQGKPYEAPAPREADPRSAPRRGLDELHGAFETVGTILSVIPTSILGMGVEAAMGPAAGKRVINAGTFMPRTPEGRRNVEAIGEAAGDLPAALPGVAPITGIAASLSRAGLGRGLEVASAAPRAAVEAARGVIGAISETPVAGVKQAPAGFRVPDAKAAAAAKKNALDLPRMEGVVKAMDNGFKLSPSAAESGGIPERVAVAAGKPALAKELSNHNAENAARLAREDVGVAPDVPLSHDVAVGIRREEGAKYAVLKNAGVLKHDAQFGKDLDGVVGEIKQAADDYPDLLNNPIVKRVEGLRKPEVQFSSAVEVVKDLRNEADKAYRSGDKKLGRAYRDAAMAVDNSMDRALTARATARGGDPSFAKAVADYKAARTRIAKTYLLDAALAGNKPGEVNPLIYGRAHAKNPELLTGPGRAIGEFATQFGKDGLAQSMSKSEKAAHFGFGDILLAALHPVGGAWDLLTVGARPGTRAVLAGERGQKAIGKRARRAVSEAQARQGAPEPEAPLGFAEGPYEPPSTRGGPANPLGDLTPDWETAPGAAPAERPPAMSADGLVQAVDDPAVTTGRRQDLRAPLEIPAVPGRPDLPDALVTGAPAESAATPRANEAMMDPGAIEARRQQVDAAAARERAEPVPVGNATEIKPEVIEPGVPQPQDARMVEIDRLKAATQSEAVRAALDKRAAAVKKDIKAKADLEKKAADAAELRSVAASTKDPEMKDHLLAEADKLAKQEKIPAGEATEITSEVIEPGAIREEGQSPNAGVGKADATPAEQAGPDGAAAPAAQRAQADEGRPGEGQVDGGRLRPDDLQPETRQEGVQADGGAGAQAGKGAGEEGQTHKSLSGFPEIDGGFMREQQRVQEVAKPSPPMSARGLAAVRRTMEEGVAADKLDKDGVSLALWALDRNPNLAKGLKQEGLQVEIAPHAGARGAYNDARELIRLVEGNTDGLTAAHELLHHAERMMPPKMQAGIRREWRRAVHAEIRNVAPLNPQRADALRLALRAMEDGDATAVEAMAPYFKSKVLDRQKDYRLVNPTEYWAENASEILHGRFSGRGSWRAEAVVWLKELIEHLKGTVGLRSDAPILKALDEILNPAKTTGERKSKNMITGSGRRDQPAQPQAP